MCNNLELATFINSSTALFLLFTSHCTTPTHAEHQNRTNTWSMASFLAFNKEAPSDCNIMLADRVWPGSVIFCTKYYKRISHKLCQHLDINSLLHRQLNPNLTSQEGLGKKRGRKKEELPAINWHGLVALSSFRRTGQNKFKERNLTNHVMKLLREGGRVWNF